MEQSSQPNETSSDAWSQGITQMNEAIRQHVTASRLMFAGALALSAGAAAYLWDTRRRNDFLDAMRKFPEDLIASWRGSGDSQKNT
jgi:hypothetical protein